MFGLLALIGRVWDWISWAFGNAWKLAIFVFNNVWAAGLIVVGVAWSMFKAGGAVLTLILNKLDELTGSLPKVSGEIPGTWVSMAQFINTIFPLSETFTLLVALLTLMTAVFVLKFFLKNRPRPFGL